MDCRKPRVGRFPGRTRPSQRTDNRQPIGAVVAHSGVLLSPGQRFAVLGHGRWHWCPVEMILNVRMHSAGPRRFNIEVMFGVLVWRTLAIEEIANVRLLTRLGA
jgi:hypothetical protein